MTIDDLGQLLWYVGLISPLATALIILIFYKSMPIGRRVIVAASFGFSIFFTLIMSSVGILFRDGMGPDSVTSKGQLAFEHSIYGLIVGIIAGLIVAIPGIYLVIRKSNA